MVAELLAGMPSRRPAVASGRSLSRRPSLELPPPLRITSALEAAPAPAEAPPHVRAAARELPGGPAVDSALHTIVTSFLKQQYRAACMAAPTPMATQPPMSLLRPFAMPAASRALEAPYNLAARGARRAAWGGHGGPGGRRLDRHFAYSRFRLLKAYREDEATTLQCCAFVRGASLLVAGNHLGELQVHDTLTGELLHVLDGHSAGVASLHMRAGELGAQLLSSSRAEARLWDVNNLGGPHLHEFEHLTKARFSNAGDRIAGIETLPARVAVIYDATTCRRLVALQEGSAAGGTGGAAGGPGGLASPGSAPERLRGLSGVCYSPADDLVLWGATLWDPRAPRAVHTFDQFTDFSSGCFHPAGLEVVLNSEIWDLRTYRLLRSVPALANTTVSFNSGGGRLAPVPEAWHVASATWCLVPGAWCLVPGAWRLVPDTFPWCC